MKTDYSRFKFMAWNKKDKVMVDLEKITPLALSDSMNTQLAMQGKGGIFIPFFEEIEIVEYVGLEDKNNKKIYADCDIFKFKLTEELHESIELIGVMTFNDIELRYEINVYSKDHPNYVCLCYQSNGQMYDFEIIGNIYENPELLESLT